MKNICVLNLNVHKINVEKKKMKENNEQTNNTHFSASCYALYTLQLNLFFMEINQNEKVKHGIFHRKKKM